VLVVILVSQRAAHAAAGPAAVTAAFGHTFWWCVGFTALAVIPALALPGRPTRARRPDSPEPRNAAEPASARR
jgi:hypothetical protein